MRKELIFYLHDKIIPIYNHFDKAHKADHVEKVIQNSLEIAKDYDLNQEMVYTIASFHDIGMQFGRKDHHLTGGQFLFDDEVLKRFFTEDQRLVMKEAVEDHRASNKVPPRSIYGKIIAEADRDINAEIVLLRTVQFGFKHYPDITKEEHIQRAYNHVLEKYGPNGYLTLWLETKKNREGLNEIHDLLTRRIEMEKMIETLYENEKNQHHDDSNED
ncbi:MAG: hypothetical protein A2Y45_06775 [Tenericutes bacterium GWC2_34_14]|nr:MAG: hypothetical protein A2Z84_01965 [Tenericutes bacterium GWA2_35_7]OHE28651.1 MAG: hypothetical protein A2Y45_06775 [Tenericutes bacterium GWC2_34_14]OHE33441.1 MAG: hypothetical protein A2012_03035 [Tenericutes bacterium GWE2_34_108]OHE36726.1 MAG: hypothetical protein A2Y46_08835 [Tenericutes bacterium GWF1_35_14]OHE38195.1 MAG: hypothetical protein A2Y44_09830 [Tenericutes bacterium GWF2_35_184]OHE43287.1 MAG: hypothetical protein A2221_05905 [Tenericutes bacterium RIFOXYA2_FULL_36_3